jgi:hypothetical protein
MGEFRNAFQPKVASELVILENTTGSISTINLELAATVAQNDSLCQLLDVRGRTTHTIHDNMTT